MFFPLDWRGKQPQEPGIIKNVQQDWCRQTSRTILEKAEHQRREEHQCSPQGRMIDKMQPRKQDARQQVRNTHRPQRLLTNVVMHQFLYQPTKNDFFNDRVEHYE